MPAQTTSNDLANELADHLIYFSHESDKWRSMLREQNPHPEFIESRIGEITRAGVSAGVSEALAHLIMLKYADSEEATMALERVTAIVTTVYAIWETMTEQQKKDSGYAPLRDK